LNRINKVGWVERSDTHHSVRIIRRWVSLRSTHRERLPEQTAIATALSDMDTALAALEARHDKTRALKQGMCRNCWPEGFGWRNGRFFTFPMFMLYN
jgi:hypothetical protein